ncbi:SO_0444 family Cu/Zn efflux transporter [Alteromonas sp. 1_MG-2023]|uniref:SO_0444 family Cu/Zn efflux transporter n=1 Tax=Alteromonas sp. 1_MG-2023 TaxID=3062669 RepID=UPI0026E38200|nr:SO_0444 family Cu/Zn efflux transporter [Alteromonas sp. 1_MG-2023]MDO6568020.1 SO_0444 family Cu/Zn efflux transporter [Alteromonas sp. 1_MG-2023]
MTDLMLLVQNFISLFMESAPWLLLGLLVAGIMHELVPVSFLERHMGSSSTASISKAAVIGAPLPLCSCGVIPAAIGLRRSGASKPSTISFLVSTPETGVDSVSVSYALLGPLYAIVRPIAAIVSAIYAGLMVRWFDGDKLKQEAHSHQAKANTPKSNTSQSHTHSDHAGESCCASKTSAEKQVEPAPSEQEQTSCCASEKPVTSCCDDTTDAQAKPAKQANKLTQVLQYASGKLLEDIVVWLLVGLALAAAIKTWVPTDFLTQWGDGVVAMLVMALIGIPMYICATASTPLAVGFLAAGLSPGAVLVFLMAGPATNVSTMGMIKQEMGFKTLCLYLFSVITASIGFGYLLNYAVSAFSLESLIHMESQLHSHGPNVQVLYAVCAVLLAALMARLGLSKLNARLNHRKVSHEGCCG